MCIVQNTGNQKLLVHSGWKTLKKTFVIACIFVFLTSVFEFCFLQEKKREEKKIVLSSSPAEATIVRPSQKEEVKHFLFFPIIPKGGGQTFSFQTFSFLSKHIF